MSEVPTMPGNGAAPSQALVKSETGKAPISFGSNGVELRSLDEAFRMARAIASSGLVPKSMDTAEKVLVAMQLGAEAGLGPMAAVRSVAVINGTPSWKGDTALALVRRSGLLVSFARGYEGEGATLTAWVRVHRKGDAEPVTGRFSVRDATKAGLWGKQGPWTQYPDRMLYYRALGFILRDVFPDVLGGLAIAEEVQDYPVERPAGERPAPAPVAELPAPAVDPLMAEVIGAESVPVHEAEPVEAPAPLPFPSHAEADRALAEAEIDEVFAPARADQRRGRRS